MERAKGRSSDKEHSGRYLETQDQSCASKDAISQNAKETSEDESTEPGIGEIVKDLRQRRHLGYKKVPGAPPCQRRKRYHRLIISMRRVHLAVNVNPKEYMWIK